MRTFLVAAAFLFFLTGCSVDDDPVEAVDYEMVQTTPLNLPEEFTVGKKEVIRLSYKRPTACHLFYSIQYEELKGELFFGVVTSYRPNQECEPQELSGTVSFDFIPESREFYIFKFWQGQNEQGEDQFITVEIPVVANSS